MSATPSLTRKLNGSLRFFVWAKTAYHAILGKLHNTNKLLLTLSDYINADILANSILQQKTNSDLIEQHNKLFTPIIFIFNSSTNN